MRSPSLVAESLRAVPEVVATTLPPVHGVDARQFQRALDVAMAPARTGAEPPPYLLKAQIDAWRRAVAALEGWSGALLAEPVGSGKTWIALAVATHRRERCTVIGPATLADQWQLTAQRAGVTIAYHSFERLSRGTPPPPAGLVIIDEAHRLRHPATRRVGVIAPWLVGRHTLLLSATPLVNRRRDLLALLDLVVPDDALTLDGIPSLRALAGHRTPPKALGRLVIRSRSAHQPLPAVTRTLRPSRAERARAGVIATTVLALDLGADPGVRQLLRTVLLDAGASSDAAFHATLRRYRSLLRQSRDAGGISRAELHRFAGAALDQLVLWPLLGDLDRSAPPPLVDLDAVDAALRVAPADDAWMAPLVRLLDDERPSVCFCRHRATARALASRIGDRTAWVTGDTAGIGPHRMRRNQVLAAFGPERDEWRLRVRTPTVLVATEVLAEGLDLQGASRVVHVDLPWHATRIEQRTGRVRRHGQRAPSIEIVHRNIPRGIERWLGQRRRIRVKGRITARWLESLTSPPAPATMAPGMASVAACSSRHRGHGTAWIRLQAGARAGCYPVIVANDGTVRSGNEDHAACPIRSPSHGELRCADRLVRRAARHALLAIPRQATGRGVLIARILALARVTAARRDRVALEHLDRLLALTLLPGTRGLDLMLARLRDAPDRELLACRVPALPDRDPAIPRSAVLLLDPGGRVPLP